MVEEEEAAGVGSSLTLLLGVFASIGLLGLPGSVSVTVDETADT